MSVIYWPSIWALRPKVALKLIELELAQNPRFRERLRAQFGEETAEGVGSRGPTETLGGSDSNRRPAVYETAAPSRGLASYPCSRLAADQAAGRDVYLSSPGLPRSSRHARMRGWPPAEGSPSTPE